MMKEVHAKLRFLHMAPRKVRLVIDTIRGLDVLSAERELLFSRKRAAQPVLKLLRSAMANAKNNFQMDQKQLFVKKITADGGPTIKRYRPRAFGSAAMIRKRSTHIMVVLQAREKSEAVQTKPKSEKRAARTPSPKKTEKKPLTKGT